MCCMQLGALCKKRLSVFSISLGCPKNRVDTEHLLGSLGFAIYPVKHIGRARLIFINTCAFIEPAVKESIHTILSIVEHVKTCKRKPFVAVGGCLVGRYGREELAKEIPEVDLWLPSRDLEKWPILLRTALGEDGEENFFGRFLSTGPSYAWLKIGDGCRHACSFCTIPQIRGGLTSYTMQGLVQEAKRLLENGISELDLVAQDVTAWQGENGESLVHLLDSHSSLPKLLWLRLLYLYPSGLSEELLRFVSERGFPLLPYFDIPLQHSHPQILERMGRPFAKDPRFILEKIWRFVPHAILRTTFIVGFPGETEAQYASLCRFVEEGHFQHVGVFAYQREEGSRAYDYANQVSSSVAEGRKRTLLEIQEEVSARKLEKYVGENMDVLIDSVNPEWPGLYNGRVWFQAPEVDGQTYISGLGPMLVPGNMVNAEICESESYDLKALV